MHATRTKIHQERLRQLGTLGASVPLYSQEPGPELTEVTLEQIEPSMFCPALDLSDGRTLYVVWLSLLAERPGVTLFDFRFVPAWPDRGFIPLPSFKESHIGQAYILPGGLSLPQHDVLNLRFVKSGWRLPDIRVEGLLAALSETPIPNHYRHGDVIPVTVQLFGRAGQMLGQVSVEMGADLWAARGIAERSRNAAASQHLRRR